MSPASAMKVSGPAQRPSSVINMRQTVVRGLFSIMAGSRSQLETVRFLNLASFSPNAGTSKTCGLTTLSGRSPHAALSMPSAMAAPVARQTSDVDADQ